MEANYLLWGVAPSSSHSLGSISSLGSTIGGSIGILTYQLMSALLHLRKFTTSRCLEVEHFNHPWTYQMTYVFPPAAFVPLVLFKFLAEHVIGQFRLPILLTPCWMEAPWLPTVLSLLKYIPHWCPIVKDLIIDIYIGWVLKDHPSLYLTFWLLRHLCCADKGFFLKSARQW